MTSYRIDLTRLTVIATDGAGEDHDLNATGEPCTSVADLHSYIGELRNAGCISSETADELHDELSAQG